MAPEAGDEVSEQSNEDEAVLAVQLFTWLLSTSAQVERRRLREGGRHGDEMLGFLLKTDNASKPDTYVTHNAGGF